MGTSAMSASQKLRDEELREKERERETMGTERAGRDGMSWRFPCQQVFRIEKR